MGHTLTHAAIGAAGFMVTNSSTLRQWPFVLTLPDVAWGTFASGACAATVWFAIR